MTATSVTGRGPGDAFPGITGPGNGRNVYVATQTPHVTAAGSITLDGAGAGTVTFPTALDDAAALYAVVVTTDNNNAVGVTKNDVGCVFANFVLAGTAADVADWAVIQIGTP